MAGSRLFDRFNSMFWPCTIPWPKMIWKQEVIVMLSKEKFFELVSEIVNKEKIYTVGARLCLPFDKDVPDMDSDFQRLYEFVHGPAFEAANSLEQVIDSVYHIGARLTEIEAALRKDMQGFKKTTAQRVQTRKEYLKAITEMIRKIDQMGETSGDEQ